MRDKAATQVKLPDSLRISTVLDDPTGASFEAGDRVGDDFQGAFSEVALARIKTVGNDVEVVSHAAGLTAPVRVIQQLAANTVACNLGRVPV